MTVARWTETPEVVEIDSLILDVTLMPREGVDEETVAEYAEAMQEEGAAFPTIHAIEDHKSGCLLLVDGWHRVAAAKRDGFTSLYARVRPGTWDDAAEAAAASNLRHGRRRTNADKRKAVSVLLALPKWAQASGVAIAKHCMVSDHLVAAVRASSASSKTRGYEQPIENIEPDFSPPPERRTVQRGGQEYPITMPHQREAVEAIRGAPESEPAEARRPRAPPSEEDLIIRQVLALAAPLSFPAQEKLRREWRQMPRPVVLGDIGAWLKTALDSERREVADRAFDVIVTPGEKLRHDQKVRAWIDEYERDNPDHEPIDDATTTGDGL
jgi:hypothetical protein